MPKNHPAVTRLLWVNSVFYIPIFLICFILPGYPQTALDFAIDDMLDNQLFGRVGFWSSLFPFNSKAAANYSAVFGPLLTAYSIFTAFKTEKDPEQIKKIAQLTTRRYLAVLIGGTLFFIFLACTFYLISHDLGTSTGKYGNLFGKNALLYSFHHSLMSSTMFSLAPLFVCSFYYSIPRFKIERWLSKRQKN
ncbi:hypothetical protein KVG96_12555 [Pseudomonas sp. COR58]|uniref:Uncharacterized protein n=1 Tax=Pseudomonas ekonensis TaxID=2842353 RepID=A0ABS6PE79_9PSED|nr:hypothetical protein [Pseudomonas ekonensis]MBV4458784.1 hypothetical protein [Pseudomonas ekonensis]